MYFMYLMYGEQDFTALSVTAPLIGPVPAHEREHAEIERHFCALSSPVGNPFRQALAGRTVDRVQQNTHALSNPAPHRDIRRTASTP